MHAGEPGGYAKGTVEVERVDECGSLDQRREGHPGKPERHAGREPAESRFALTSECVSEERQQQQGPEEPFGDAKRIEGAVVGIEAVDRDRLPGEAQEIGADPVGQDQQDDHHTAC